MTKHILCAVDLTHPESEVRLLKKSAELAEFYGATLSVVTVIPDYGMSIVGSYFKEGTMKAADFPDFESESGFRPPQTEFIDDKVFDGTRPNAYLEQFPIGLKGDDKI